MAAAYSAHDRPERSALPCGSPNALSVTNSLESKSLELLELLVSWTDWRVNQVSHAGWSGDARRRGRLLRRVDPQVAPRPRPVADGRQRGVAEFGAAHSL